MNEDKAKELVGYIADGVIEGLKFAPEKADEFLEIISERIKNADWAEAPNAVKILESAVNCGVVISAETATLTDDKLFGKAKTALEKYEASGGNIFATVMAFLVKKVKG